jgi:pimeloyl-ACP methyl ester carboxylesterase
VSKLLAVSFSVNSSSNFPRYGPSSLVVDGTLKTWTAVPVLHKIAAPTLVYNGEYDTSHDIMQVPFFELIPRVRWITFPNSGHMCHLEDSGLRKRVLEVVGEFLTQEEVSA